MKKILVADDDRKIVTALTVRLKAAGYEVLGAPNGFEGFKLTVGERPDLLILDIWMPIGHGFSLAQRLAAAGLADLPIIFLTASKKRGLREAAMGVGAVAFFEKPYNANELLATIARVLEEKRNPPAKVLQTAAPAETPVGDSKSLKGNGSL